MPDTSTILSLPLILPAQAQKHVTHNEALRLLDIVVQLAVIDRSLATPPSAVPGDRYIVPAAATGAWAGNTGKIALFEDGLWQFVTPLAGWRAWVADEAAVAAFNGTTWATLAEAPLSVIRLGVAATADATNRLAVSSPATLLNHAGGGHQLKVNKAAATDTASLLFQAGFSGRAEMGTMGNDDFGIKVSPDGATFFTAMTVARADGQITLPAPLRLGGQASDPVSPANGAIWLNTTTSEVKMRSNGVSVVVATASGGVTDGDKGDVSVSGTGAVWTIDPGVVGNAKLASVATATFKGRSTAGSGAPEDLTATQARGLLNVADGATVNAADASLRDRSTHTGTQLAATVSDFSTAVAATAAVTANTAKVTNATHTGDVTGATVLTIAAGVVTLANQANMPAGSLFYRKTAAAGPPEIQTLATLKTDLALTGTNTGDQTTIVGITGTKAQFNTAVSDGDILYVGDVTSNATHTGDVTGATALTIAAGVVTLANQANMPAGSLFYRKTAAAGPPEIQTLATLKTDLALTGTNTGDQTTIVGITGTKAQFNTAVSDGDILYVGDVTSNATHTGDVTGATVLTIAAGAVTLAQQASILTASFIGRNTAATGVQEVLSVATAKTMLGLAGTNTGDQTITLTGDSTGTGTGSFATTLATVNANVGSFGLAASVAQFTANAKGLITAAANVAIAVPAAQITDSTVAGRAVLLAVDATAQRAALGLGALATQSGTFSGASSGTNTGDQTSVVGIAGTRAQFNTAVSDGDIQFVGDAPTAHVHTLAALSQSSATTNQVPQWNGLAWVPATVSGGGATNLSYDAASRVVSSDTGTDATLPLVTSGDAGLAPASGGGSANFLRADGIWAAPAGGGVPDGAKGDVIVSDGGTVWTLDPGVRYGLPLAIQQQIYFN